MKQVTFSVKNWGTELLSGIVMFISIQLLSFFFSESTSTVSQLQGEATNNYGFPLTYFSKTPHTIDASMTTSFNHLNFGIDFLLLSGFGAGAAYGYKRWKQ